MKIRKLNLPGWGKGWPKTWGCGRPRWPGPSPSPRGGAIVGISGTWPGLMSILPHLSQRIFQVLKIIYISGLDITVLTFLIKVSSVTGLISQLWCVACWHNTNWGLYSGYTAVSRSRSDCRGRGRVSGRAQLDCPWSRLHVYQWLDVDTDTVGKAEAAQEGRARAGPHTRTRVCTGLALATEARDMKHPDNLGRYCTRPTLDTTYHTDTRHSLHLPLHLIK